MSAWPLLHDPSDLARWLLSAGCLVAAGLCLVARRATRIGATLARRHGSPERRHTDRAPSYTARLWFWTLLAVTLVLTAVDHHLALHDRVTELFRDIARHQGWYLERRHFQAELVRVLVPLTSAILALIIVATRRLLRRHVVPLVGAGGLIALMVLALVSYHHLDAALMRDVAGVQTRWLLEFLAIAAVAYGAVSTSRWLGFGVALPSADASCAS